MLILSVRKDNFTLLSSKTSLKLVFKTCLLASLWLSVWSDYSELSNQALMILVTFPITYLCKQLFSALK